MKVRVVCRKLYDYVRIDLKEIAFPSSLPDPPHLKKRRKLTWKENWYVFKEASRLYAASWVRDIGPDLRPNDYKKDTDDYERSLEDDKKEPSIVEDLVVAARGGMETLKPALQRVYMMRASAYRDALKSFIVGYQEGIQQVVEEKGSSKAQEQEDGGSSKTQEHEEDELPPYATADERIVDIQGEPLKVLRALESVVEHLRKFLVDHSVLPLFEKSLTASVAQEPQPLVQTSQQTAIGNDYLLPKRDSYTERESQMDPHRQRSGLSLYGQDPALASLRPPAFGRTPGSLVTQITQTMQIPLGYAEDIIGVSGRNIGFIRNTSGAVVTVHESRGNPDDIIIEIKGTSSQVQNAQQLIEDFVNKGQVGTGYGGAEPGLGSSYAEPLLRSSYAEPGLRSSYGEPGFRSSYLGSSAYSSSLGEPPLGGYGSSGLGSYNSYTRY